MNKTTNILQNPKNKKRKQKQVNSIQVLLNQTAFRNTAVTFAFPKCSDQPLRYIFLKHIAKHHIDISTDYKVYTLRPEHNDQCVANDIFKCIPLKKYSEFQWYFAEICKGA